MTYLRLPKTDLNSLTNKDVVTRNDEDQKDINQLLKEGYKKINREEWKAAINRRKLLN